MYARISKNIIIKTWFNIAVKSSKETLYKSRELKRALWPGFSPLWKQNPCGSLFWWVFLSIACTSLWNAPSGSPATWPASPEQRFQRQQVEGCVTRDPGFLCSGLPSTTIRAPCASQPCQGFLHWLCRLFPCPVSFYVENTGEWFLCHPPRSMLCFLWVLLATIIPNMQCYHLCIFLASPCLIACKPFPSHVADTWKFPNQLNIQICMVIPQLASHPENGTHGGPGQGPAAVGRAHHRTNEIQERK